MFSCSAVLFWTVGGGLLEGIGGVGKFVGFHRFNPDAPRELAERLRSRGI